MRSASRVLGIVVGLAVLSLHATALGQQQCLYGPVALPGLSGAPEWFDFDSDGFWRPELHDPRWSGSPIRLMKYAANNVGVDEAQFRVLKLGDVIYVSLQSRVDDTPAAFPDAIHVGITEGAGLGGYAIKMLLHTSGAAGTAPADPDGAGPAVVPQDATLPRHIDAASGSLKYWHTADASSGAGWDATPSTSYAAISSWFKDIAIWTGSPGAAWAVTFRIDLGPSGLNGPGDPKIFLGVESSKTVGTVRLGNVAPSASGVGSGSSIVPLDSDNWEPYVSSGAACAGVTLDRADVGKWTGAAGSTVGTLNNTICANTACGDVDNVFSLTARKVPNATLGDWVLRARLRIAAWGSTIDDWKFAPWKDVHSTPAGSNVFSALAPPAAGAELTTGNGWYWLSPVDAGDGTSAVTIHYQCNRGSDPYCPKLVDETQPHQCMLVELGQPGTDLTFTNNAVYRNMDYSGLSSIDVPATISLQGLQAATGSSKPRDVYFYVQAENLPARGRRAIGLPTKQMELARQFSEHPIVVPRPAPPTLDRARLARLSAPQKLALARTEATRASLLRQAGRIANDGRKFYGKVSTSSILAMGPDQLLDAVWPTYRVHPYYDTGESVTENGATRRILAPMVPFGFYLSHDGPLYGFEHALQAAAGGALEDLGHGWYKLKLHDESSAQLRTSITAAETPSEGDTTPPPKCPPPIEHGPHGCGCGVLGAPAQHMVLAWSALGLGVALASIRRRRRRSRV